ncbi:hypothetical protein BDA96_06G241300 [Sorghum bicolor]|jgi:hypothetical protein|uniref:Uncharacterized protein n=2 Tax=Sorghum bicolor TaxID=4558 RepID=A0A921QTI0_SORBI|nr:hypothetical protein BDA96_06G241300 [Sorghum bicolor]KXG27142.1 hypothetical protein SORBI_3006G220100 [Sorghum bicolor]
MQCLARAVARSARAAAAAEAEGYGGRRFASTGSLGASAGAAKAYNYNIRQRRRLLQERMRLAHERRQLRRILAKLEAVEGNLDKRREAPLGAGFVRFVLRTRFCAAICVGLVARQLFFGTTTPSVQDKE